MFERISSLCSCLCIPSYCLPQFTQTFKLSEELLSLWSTSHNCRVMYWVGQKVCLGVCKMVQETQPTFWLTQCLEETRLFRFSCSFHNKAEKTGISVHILWMRQLKFSEFSDLAKLTQVLEKEARIKLSISTFLSHSSCAVSWFLSRGVWVYKAI